MRFVKSYLLRTVRVILDFVVVEVVGAVFAKLGIGNGDCPVRDFGAFTLGVVRHDSVGGQDILQLSDLGYREGRAEEGVKKVLGNEDIAKLKLLIFGTGLGSCFEYLPDHAG